MAAGQGSSGETTQPFAQRPPLLFYVPPCEEKPRLRALIEAGGGVLVATAGGGEPLLHILPENGDARYLRGRLGVSARFVERCMAEGRLLDWRDFAVGAPPPRAAEYGGWGRRPLTPTAAGRPGAAPAARGVKAERQDPPAGSAPAAPAAPAVAAAPPAAPAAAPPVAPAAAQRAGAQEAVGARGADPRFAWAGRHVGRVPFSAEEDEAMERWVASHPSWRDQGQKLWQEAERAGITRHPWAAMQNRWRRKLRTRRGAGGQGGTSSLAAWIVTRRQEVAAQRMARAEVPRHGSGGAAVAPPAGARPLQQLPRARPRPAAPAPVPDEEPRPPKRLEEAASACAGAGVKRQPPGEAPAAAAAADAAAAVEVPVKRPRAESGEAEVPWAVLLQGAPRWVVNWQDTERQIDINDIDI